MGGQGIILAGHILGKAFALYEEKEVVFTEYYGPESRGGLTTSSLVVDDEKVHYPYVTDADVLVAMSQAGYEEFKSILKEDGLLIYDSDIVKPDDEKEKTAALPFVRMAKEKVGKHFVANMIMLGFLTARTDILSADSVRKAISESVPQKTVDMNVGAFDIGLQEGGGHENNQ